MKRALSTVAAIALLAAMFPYAALAQDLADYDPIGDVSSEMSVAAGNLQKLKTGKPTQKHQLEAIRKLDVLIEELEKQAGAAGQMVSNNPSRPAQTSTVRQGPGGSGKLHAERNAGKDWGQLPPHERDRILQSMTQGFPAHYQAILERYFKRLAEEKSTASDESATAPPRSTPPKPVNETPPNIRSEVAK